MFFSELELIKHAAFLDELTKISFGLEEASRIARLAKGLVAKERIANLVGPAYVVPGIGDPSLWGKILYPPRRGTIGYLKSTGSPELGRVLKSLSPEDKKLFEQLGLAHEMAERHFTGVPSGEALAKAMESTGIGHAPGVIPVEHNILSTLPTEHSPVREAQKLLRQDDPAIQAFERATGGRIPFGSGQRLSRHARRRITELMQG